MKIHTHDSAFAFMLVVIAVPAVLVGVLTVSAASEISPVSKSTYHQLFELRSFRLQQRLNRQDTVPASATESHPAAKTVPPCVPVDADAQAEVEVKRHLIFEDLNMQQREVLRMQLRIGGCPQDAEPEYKALCESMLKRQVAPETKAGLKHPEQ